jgi:hypothetical protein
LYCNFWKFMIHIKFIICSPLCLILVSSLCELWTTMCPMWGLYSFWFYVWCKCNNPSFNDDLWSTNPYYPSMYSNNYWI